MAEAQTQEKEEYKDGFTPQHRTAIRLDQMRSKDEEIALITKLLPFLETADPGENIQISSDTVAFLRRRAETRQTEADDINLELLGSSREDWPNGPNPTVD